MISRIQFWHKKLNLRAIYNALYITMFQRQISDQASCADVCALDTPIISKAIQTEIALMLRLRELAPGKRVSRTLGTYGSHSWHVYHGVINSLQALGYKVRHGCDYMEVILV